MSQNTTIEHLVKNLWDFAYHFIRPFSFTLEGCPDILDPRGDGIGLFMAKPPGHHPKISTFLLLVGSERMIAHFFQLIERNNFYFVSFFSKIDIYPY